MTAAPPHAPRFDIKKPDYWHYHGFVRNQENNDYVDVYSSWMDPGGGLETADIILIEGETSGNRRVLSLTELADHGIRQGSLYGRAMRLLLASLLF